MERSAPVFNIRGKERVNRTDSVAKAVDIVVGERGGTRASKDRRGLVS